MRVLAVTSGGMDSMAMGVKAKHDGHEVVLFHGDLGQKAELPERRAVRVCGEILGVSTYFVDLSWVGKLKGSVLTDPALEVPKGIESLRESNLITKDYRKKQHKGKGLWTPARNVILLASASVYAERYGFDMLTLGANQSETAYPDNRLEFLKRFEYMLEYGTLRDIEVSAPLYEMDKVDLVEWEWKNGYSKILAHTWSCDLGEVYQCGECGCCMNRRLAFYIAKQRVPGIEDNQRYENENYFREVYLPAIRKPGAMKGMWFEKYSELILK